MSEVVIKFTLPEEQEEMRLAMTAGEMHSALWDIAQEVFRPARKHGYPQREIQEALDKCNEGEGEELVHLLERRFYEILEEHGIKLN
jgi:hypothetical protein